MYFNPLDELDTPGISGPQVDIRVVQRKARKYITTCSGLPNELDYDKVLSALKSLHHCSGCIRVDKDTEGKVLQLTGDQREAIKSFLVEQGIVAAESIRVHGY